MAGARGEGLSILRTLYRELRPTVNAPQAHVYETQLWKYIVGLCKTCKTQPAAEMEQVHKNLESTGRSYIFYLQSYKEYHRISDDYKGAGERSAGDTAKMLGFKMPDEPRDPPKRGENKVTSDSPQGNDRIQNADERQSTSTAPFAYSSPIR